MTLTSTLCATFRLLAAALNIAWSELHAGAEHALRVRGCWNNKMIEG